MSTATTMTGTTIGGSLAGATHFIFLPILCWESFVLISAHSSRQAFCRFLQVARTGRYIFYCPKTWFPTKSLKELWRYPLFEWLIGPTAVFRLWLENSRQQWLRLPQ